ncbi:MAG: TerC/Alx family metal homeostasis membrane protein, partial [Saprospiraceae bacterium]|nr:TerC/Alx family metal homeostasis membrane protein [Saprospiraceae bacterium]
LVLLFLALDLGVFHRRSHVVRAREALCWTSVWVALALLFNVAIYYLYEAGYATSGAAGGTRGSQAAIQFFTGYLIEKSLSLDNIFVIALIFAYFRVPAEYQHRILFWGILGALIMRGIMIGIGTGLIHRFHWMSYVFGALLIFTAARMLVIRHDNLEPDRNVLVRAVRRFYPVTAAFDGPRFFTTVAGVRSMTPMMIALLVVESSDILFAIDSIPAIF